MLWFYSQVKPNYMIIKISSRLSSSVLLLSDGQNFDLNNEQLGEKLKSFIKGEGQSFNLNSFRYGYDHEPKIIKEIEAKQCRRI